MLAETKSHSRSHALIVFVDESGISERPTRVRTWALKGQTLVIQFHFNWNHVPVIAGLTRINCTFRLYMLRKACADGMYSRRLGASSWSQLVTIISVERSTE